MKDEDEFINRVYKNSEEYRKILRAHVKIDNFGIPTVFQNPSTQKYRKIEETIV